MRPSLYFAQAHFFLFTDPMNDGKLKTSFKQTQQSYQNMVLLEINSFLITSLTLLADTINEFTTHGNNLSYVVALLYES